MIYLIQKSYYFLVVSLALIAILLLITISLVGQHVRRSNHSYLEGATGTTSHYNPFSVSQNVQPLIILMLVLILLLFHSLGQVLIPSCDTSLLYHYQIYKRAKYDIV